MKKIPPVQAKRPPYPVKAGNGAARSRRAGRSKEAGL